MDVRADYRFVAKHGEMLILLSSSLKFIFWKVPYQIKGLRGLGGVSDTNISQMKKFPNSFGSSVDSGLAVSTILTFEIALA